MAKAELRPVDVRIDNVRLSFPVLAEPKMVMNGATEDKTLYFQASFLLPPDFDRKPVLRALTEAKKAAWGDTPMKFEGHKNPLRECSKLERRYDGYADGWFVIRTKTKRKPALVDRNGQPLTDPSKLYAGCWVNAFLSAFTWDHKLGGKGLSLSLNAIQFVRDGDRLDGGVNALDVFEPLDDSEIETLAGSGADGIDDILG